MANTPPAPDEFGPPASESKKISECERRLFAATAPLKAGATLRQELKLDELNFLHRVGYGVEDTRAYFLYGCLDEVFKVCTSILRWIEFVAEPKEESLPPEDVTDEQKCNMHRVVREAVLDEQFMWARKLNELLSDLILFSTTNEQPYYRIYLACRQLDGYLGLQADCDEFFACTNENAEYSIRDLTQIVAQEQKLIDPSRLWFLNGPISGAKLPGPGRMFSSARKRYKQALQAATPDQRASLGISYDMGYSQPSRSIHSNIGGFSHEGVRHTVETNITRVGFMAAHLVSAAYTLAGVKPVGIAAYINDPSRTAESQARMDSTIASDFAVGDIVTPHGKDVCEIVEKKKSAYGYTSYKVRYLTPPLLPGLLEDWYPAAYVRLLSTRNALRNRLVDIFKSIGATPEELRKVQEFPDSELTKAMMEVLRPKEGRN
jgi:hypothetical protein